MTDLAVATDRARWLASCDRRLARLEERIARASGYRRIGLLGERAKLKHWAEIYEREGEK